MRDLAARWVKLIGVVMILPWYVMKGDLVGLVERVVSVLMPAGTGATGV